MNDFQIAGLCGFVSLGVDVPVQEGRAVKFEKRSEQMWVIGFAIVSVALIALVVPLGALATAELIQWAGGLAVVYWVVAILALLVGCCFVAVGLALEDGER